MTNKASKYVTNLSKVTLSREVNKSNRNSREMTPCPSMNRSLAFYFYPVK